MIDVTDFLQQEKFLKFDYLLGVAQKSETGKILKIPIRAASDFTNPAKSVKDVAEIKNAVADPKKVPYSIIGVILKNEEGLAIFDKKLICIDIDCKTKPEKAEEIYSKVKVILLALGLDEKLILKLSEKTISGGYHIFLTSNAIYPQQKLFVEEGIEIEIFSSNRYIAVAPSLNYTPLSGASCVEFNEAYNATLTNVDLDFFVFDFLIPLINWLTVGISFSPHFFSITY